MPKILDGKEIAKQINEETKKIVESTNNEITLATVYDPNNVGSDMYVSMKHKKAHQLGINTVEIPINEDETTQNVIKKVIELNNDTEITAILVQSPLPKNVDELKVFSAIDPKKDADGLSAINQGWLFGNIVNEDFIAPATPAGVMELLRRYEIPIASRNVVVVGRSQLFGRPMSALFMNADANVSVLHKGTKKEDLIKYLQAADIIAIGIGQAQYIQADWIKDGAVVIDAGANKLNGKTTGDVDPKAFEKTSFYTPVPGGVGPMTIATLLKTVAELGIK
jgi:methylenetetrahydrofolate dehydrogenase (NADP+)/methenyltetrahydrofolate cyclohydrolase